MIKAIQYNNIFVYIALLKTTEGDQSAAQRMQIKEMNKIITHTVK